MRYTLLVTGPAYGTQQASAAWQFASALLRRQHHIHAVFFYQDGVLNANRLNAPASDEFNLTEAWQMLAQQHQIPLYVCVSAALRRGVLGEQEARQHGLDADNLAEGFCLSGLGALAESLAASDRLMQF